MAASGGMHSRAGQDICGRRNKRTNQALAFVPHGPVMGVVLMFRALSAELDLDPPSVRARERQKASSITVTPAVDGRWIVSHDQPNRNEWAVRFSTRADAEEYGAWLARDRLQSEKAPFGVVFRKRIDSPEQPC